jgi:hypothetical protein
MNCWTWEPPLLSMGQSVRLVGSRPKSLALVIEHPPSRARDSDFPQLVVTKPAQGVAGLARVMAAPKVSVEFSPTRDQAGANRVEQVRKRRGERRTRRFVISLATRGHADLAFGRDATFVLAGMQTGAQAWPPQQFSVR